MNRQNIEDIYPLSPMQHGMLFHTLLDAGSEVYFEQIHCVLGDALDVPAFKRAWGVVVDRHPILRTIFLWEGLESPMQIVCKKVTIPWTEEDVRALPQDAKAARFQAYLEADRGRRFALDEEPAQRFALLRVGEGTYRFVWSFHHLVLDGWSLPILMQDLFTLYAGFVQGKSPRLPEPKPFGDYIEWIGQQDMGRAEAFWRARLGGFLAATPFRVDHPPVAAEGESLAHAGGTYAEQHVAVGEAGAASLQAFARQHKLTLSTLVQGAWSLLLARYSGEEDVLFGATVSGRSAAVAGMESVVGMCINMMPVRVAVDGDKTVTDWLTGLQARSAELAEYEYSPLVEVQGWSDIQRGEPLFQSIVTFENYPFDDAMLAGAGGLSVREFTATLGSNYPITVVCLPGPKGIEFRVVYNTTRLDEGVMARLATHLRTLLEELPKDGARRVSAVPMLPESERRTVLFGWNDTAAAWPEDRLVHELFQEQARLRPDAPAVAYEGAQLTYRELEARANRLAHRLRSEGVGPDVVVAIAMKPSLDIVVALLGVLVAGGAYVPLDPKQPAERLAHMLDETAAPVILTQAIFAGGLPQTGARVLCLDTDWPSIAAESADSPARAQASSSLAYVLFTSGSTGKPKGVSIEHRNLVHYVTGVMTRLDLPPGATYALVSTFAADLGNTVTFPSLCGGGCLHVIAEERTTDALALADYFGEHGIDCLKIVPSHLAALLATSDARVVPKKRLVLGGEASSWALVDTVARLRPDCVVLNHYGPTETTVGVVTHRVDRSVREAPIVPLGRPLPNVQMYLLDRHGMPAPIGVPGEVYIGGPGVARGYLGRPDLTEERFLPHPFSDRPGARVYRTGDLAKWLPGGDLLFLGRADHQVKIRGFRIELGEIEATLKENGSVRDAVVMVKEDGGDRRLVAFVVPQDPPAPPMADVRAAIAGRLPDYMVPSSMLWIDSVPLTPNGKIDRQALLARDAEATSHTDAFTAPRTPVEEVLAGIWADVFEAERVGVHDNFNELGGHSLLAIQVIARTREAFGVSVPLRSIFDAPTVAGLAERIEAAIRAGTGLDAPPVERAAPGAEAVLSFAQERLWFLDQLEPNNAFYNVPAAIRLTGRLDVPALERAIGEVVRRHDVLRTTFDTAEGRARPVVRAWSVTLPVLDLGAEADREAAARREATAEAALPFDLATGPLYRAKLLRLGETGEGLSVDHVLLFTMHHIVSDAWARGVLVRELAALYEAFARGKPSPLPPLSIQYGDFAAWQRSWLQGDVLDRQLAYWTGHLAGAPRALELPTDRPRPPLMTFRGAMHHFDVPADVAQGLTAIARSTGVTLFMTLLAGFEALLARWAGTTDVVVGTPIANRTQRATEELIGFFVNTLVLRTDLAGDPTFEELLGRVREVSLGAYAHQDLPFERLVEALHPERDLSRSPLFQVMFVLQNAPLPPLSLPGLLLGAVDADAATAKFDLTLIMAESPGGGLHGAFEYATDLFDAATMARLGEGLNVLLRAAAADATRKVSALPILTDAERHTLLTTWNDTAAAYPRERTIHALIAEQAARTPDAVAVAAEDGALSYAELDRRATRLASFLQARGVAQGTPVAICVSRSLAMATGILGILKAGGAYVPFDPAWPRERLAFILDDARSPLLLTEEAIAATLDLGAVPLVRLDADWAIIEGEGASVPLDLAAPASLAYAIYTSGSTGKPKGVGVTHQNLVASTHARFAYYDEPVSAFLLLSSFSFDSSVAGIFWTLCQGGTLVLPREGVTDDPREITALIERRRVSHMLCVPSLYAVILDEAPQGALASLRCAVVAGESAMLELVARHEATLPGARLFNEYGPTEATVWCTVAELKSSDRHARMSIGRAIPNAQIYIVDPSFELQPIGVPGEIVVGGEGVTPGYLNLPELTRERFVTAPFAGEARLYRTGDLGRFRADGAIEFLGRVDSQVKIRGYRIELEEIEAALAACAGVRDAAVTVFEEGADKRLVGYFVPEASPAPTVAELRAALKRTLPDYMVPPVLLALAAMPLLPNGKIDRRALPAPEGRAGMATGFTAPRGPVEDVVANIWAELLKIERVSVHDDFFDLGGHSLLATQVVARIRNAFSTDIPLQRLFESPTVAGLAEAVSGALREGHGMVAPPIARAARGEDLALSFAQERLWFLDQLEPNNPFYNVPAAIRITGPAKVPALARTLNAITRRHEALRTRFPTVGGRPSQVIEEALDVPLDVLDWSHLAPDEQKIQVRAEAARHARWPFDLARGPLVAAKLVRLAPEDHVLLFTMHHIVSDGWSIGVLLQEVAALYDAIARGDEPPLADLPIQYADYAAWQRRWLDGEVLGKQLAYWKKQLAGAPMVLELPTDRPRPAVQTFRGARRFFELDPALASGLQALSRREGVTLFMTLVAAFNVLLGRYAGQEDVLVGTPIANRTRAETEGLIGFLVNTLVLRTDLSGEPTFRELLRRVRAMALGAYAHQDLPFERLVEVLQPERDLSRTPLFQVMFVLQNFSWPALKLTDLKLEEVDAEIVTAKFEIMLTIIEGQEGLGQKGSLYGKIEYNTDLFDAATIERMLAHYLTLLAGIVAAPDTKTWALPLLPTDERALVLGTWQATSRPYRTGVTLHRLFEEQAARTPDAPAVTFEGQSISYRELDRRANQLGHHLQRLGVGRDVLVAVCIDRSIEMLVGLYGILKAGGAYVPIDPTYPKARIAFFLEDAAAPVLLTQQGLAETLGAQTAHVLCLDSGWAAVAEEPETPPASDTGPADLAYMIYTSGSTGRPKGAMNTHAGIVNRLFWMQEAYALDATDTVLQKTPFSFDVSVWELFWPLLVGARLVVARPDGHKDASYLVKLIAEERVTTLHFVPSMLQVFLEEPSVSTLTGLRRVIASGEALPLSLTERFFAHLPTVELHNLYGPTEAAIDVTWWACEKATQRPSVPIGKAIANTQIYVLDAHLQPVPIGVPGELFIGGVQVARGYLNRPDLTAERFLQSPFGGPGDRLYRTGDLTRFLPDGNVEYIRRIDHQVKLRGFRIELGEIEAALTEQPSVREAVVIVREDIPGDKRLATYLVLDPTYQESEKAAPEAAEAHEDRTSQWQMLYDETYRTSSAEDPAFNIVGWNSSYTLGAIPPEEMRVWVDETVRQIRELGGGRVLEMGCGTGLLLFNVAPHCTEYVGADFSAGALEYIERRRTDVPGGLPMVRLELRTADDTSGIPDDSFDVVVCNSVVQYFSNIDYLMRVIEGAARVVRPGGHIFLGDVRNYQLLRALRASVGLFQAQPSATTAFLRDQMLRQALSEEELVIDPAFFPAMVARTDKLSHVEVRLKPGRYDNELSRFRCDVVLHVGPRDVVGEGAKTLDWRRDGLTLASIEERLATGTLDFLAVRHMPNARVADDVEVVSMLTTQEGIDTAGDVREGLHAPGRAAAVDPEDVRDLAARLPYDVTLSWAAGRPDGSFDVVFARKGAVPPGAVVAPPVEAPAARPWSQYANDPLRSVVADKVVKELKAVLGDRLPDYMMPSAFVLLDALPLTPNGKVDRRALPAPEARAVAPGDVVAPRNPVEEVLAGIYAQVLGVEKVSIHDDFFDLGGHSLLATQAVSRVRAAFSVELSLTTLFEAPTVATLAAKVEAAVREGYGVTAPPIEVASREGTLALSFGQERMWFLDQLEPNSPSYNVPAAVRLSGKLDVPALVRALTEITRRHEVLRTTFPTTQGKARQVIASPPDFPLPVVDLRALTADEREATALREATIDAQTPFDLAKGPLVRARLLELSDDEHVLLFALHHIVSDGWSLGVLVREVAVIYEAFAANKPSPLPDLDIQYADYAAWQRRFLDGDVLERQLGYWRSRLAGAPQAIDLPTDRPRPPVQTFRGAQQPFSLPASLTKTLAQVSRKEGVTMFMTLLAAYHVLLGRYSRQDDILVGTPIANRTRSETEGLIGFLINTLVLRGDLSGDPTFKELLARVREASLGAYAHQDVPFERLVEALQPARDLSRSPLFQVMFALQNTPLAPVRVTGLSLRGVAAQSGSAKFDLTLTLEEGEEGLVGYFEYNTDLFDAATVARMAGHYRMILEGIAESPNARVGSIPLLTRPERRTLLVDWNATEREYPKDARITDLFEAQARRRPAAIAAVFEDAQLTYAELDARSNRLARHLAARGVGPGKLVGLCVSRSLEMVVALLAILKAGGAYVPLDPEYPKARLAFILQDAGAPVLVTERALAGLLAAPTGGLVLLDDDAAAVARESDGPLEQRASAASPAYAIYTSGSTGQPKGVLVPHRALVNFVLTMADRPGLRETDTLLAVTSLSFDIAGLEIYLPLVVGAKVDVASREVASDGQKLRERLAGSGATLMQATPATWRLLLDAGWEGTPGLVILCGGEAFPRPLAAELAGKGASVWNMFGPTETTIWSAIHEVRGGAGPIPIGRPVANTQLYIVDPGQGLAPVGVPGELWIGGDGVALGYHQRDALTAERFVDNPFRTLHGATGEAERLPGSDKVYRTGDLARYLPSGDVEFLGRLDHQVKVRGFRIELGEIEAVLGTHPSVREVVVVAREDVPGDVRLVAYISLGEGAAPTLAEARAFLREKLPDYMLPAHFVVLEALPRTPNGKTDRKALPAPDRGHVSRAPYVAPRTAAEQVVASVFAEVVGAERVGVKDDFFELGGHSLLAAQLTARLRDAFRIDLPVRALFESATVEGVVESLTRLWGDPEIVETIAETIQAVLGATEEELQAMMKETE